MNLAFEYITTLEYRLKAANAKVLAFTSGKKYVDMKAEFDKMERSYKRKVRELEDLLSKAHSETVTVRKYWSQIFDDIEKEHKTELCRFLRQIKDLKKRLIEAERQRDEALTKVTEQRHQIYELGTEPMSFS